jgi:hypothetical protein
VSDEQRHDDDETNAAIDRVQIVNRRDRDERCVQVDLAAERRDSPRCERLEERARLREFLCQREVKRQIVGLAEPVVAKESKERQCGHPARAGEEREEPCPGHDEDGAPSERMPPTSSHRRAHSRCDQRDHAQPDVRNQHRTHGNVRAT